MAFTSKISTILKQSANNLVGNLVGTSLSKLANFANQANTAKLAANLANKSPLEIDNSPVAHMKENPYDYGQLYYPEETSQLGEGHYVIFDIIANDKSTMTATNFDNKGKLTVGGFGDTDLDSDFSIRLDQQEKRFKKLKDQGYYNSNSQNIVRQQSSGVASYQQTHSRIQDTVILYTPPNVKFDYKAGYENADTGMAQLIMGTIADIKGGKEALSAGGEALKVFLEKAAVGALELAFPGVQGFIDKTRGKSVNPQTELVFKNVPFRTFSFPFEFAAKNTKELDTIHKIIQLFKFHMMPEIQTRGFLIAPSEFQITYMYKDKANMYIPKISRCALTDFNVDYSPEGVFTTFRGDDKGAAPVLIKAELTFTEMEIMTKATIAEGH